jgi:hypothetical protein
MEHMMEYFIPEGSVSSESEHHKRIRHGIEEPLDTPDDEEFTQEEILAVIEKFVGSWQSTRRGRPEQ